ncbi:predicted protein [Histoplasma capsulatum G186AR]|uniref:Uncharacterized protein n=1 Tax=Ajellomyces capsulatus (strain G186AR / H82 / ATCC MYA-2454 / RMSCC 2432) TaxID=447093 RepID=C0NAP4_AJECG|nr:uncharacterized protein HCBG_00190 [Histoplasma capsulatum G186AR]EEH10735.1 predicted protein [Histoplasma capsulatum G186AR]
MDPAWIRVNQLCAVDNICHHIHILYLEFGHSQGLHASSRLDRTAYGREGKDEDRKAEARDEWLRDSRCLVSHVVASIALSNVVFLGTIYRFDAVLMDRKRPEASPQPLGASRSTGLHSIEYTVTEEPSGLRSQLLRHRRQRRITTAYGLVDCFTITLGLV